MPKSKRNRICELTSTLVSIVHLCLDIYTCMLVPLATHTCRHAPCIISMTCYSMACSVGSLGVGRVLLARLYALYTRQFYIASLHALCKVTRGNSGRTLFFLTQLCQYNRYFNQLKGTLTLIHQQHVHTNQLWIRRLAAALPPQTLTAS